MHSSGAVANYKSEQPYASAPLLAGLAALHIIPTRGDPFCQSNWVHPIFRQAVPAETVVNILPSSKIGPSGLSSAEARLTGLRRLLGTGLMGSASSSCAAGCRVRLVLELRDAADDVCEGVRRSP